MHKTNCERGNFPIDGPVMQNRTHGWEPTSEKMTPCEGIIREDTIMYLIFEGVKLLMSVLKELQVITLASTAVYRHVSDLILMDFPPESLKSHQLLCIMKLRNKKRRT